MIIYEKENDDKKCLLQIKEIAMSVPMIKPRSIALLMAHPPMIAKITYMKKFRSRRRETAGLILSFAI